MLKKTALSAAFVASMFMLSGCGGDSDNTPQTKTIKSVEFQEVSVPASDSEIVSVRVSDKLIIRYDDGSIQEYPLSYNEVLKTGATLGSAVFGQLLDIDNQSFKNLAYSTDYISYNPDANSIIKVGDKYYLITHFEEPGGMLYKTEIDPLTLKAKSTENIDFSSIDGTLINCAGTRTPWNTHLGGEEDYNLNTIYADNESPHYSECVKDANGYFTGNNSSGKGDYFCQYVGSMQRYLKDMNIDITNGYHGDRFNPYKYGFNVEVKINNDGTTQVAKHYITGKYTPEQAIIMPDNKTMYLSDDGSYKGFYKLVLDKPQTEFNTNWCGTLYAAKLDQYDSQNGGIFNLSWIKLGSSCDSDVKKLIDRKFKVSDIFDIDKNVKNSSTANLCRTDQGYSLIVEDGLTECIKLKVGSSRSNKFANDNEVKTAAAFLETRRYAGVLGATIEFEKGEGLTYNPDENKVYIAISSIRNGMSDSLGDIRLPSNDCGGVYEIGLDNNYNAYYMKGLVNGVPLKDGDAGSDKNRCDVNKISNPDNIRYIGKDILLIGEDTSFHLNNMAWAYNLKTKKLTRIATVPTGAEITGVFEVGNINNNYVISLNVQHPFVDKFKNVKGEVVNQTYLDQNKDKKKGIVGFIKGIPAGIFSER